MSSVTAESAMQLGERLAPIIRSLISEVVDHPDQIRVVVLLEEYTDPTKVKFRSSWGLRIQITVLDDDIRQAKGQNSSIQDGINSWLAAVRGKNRTPIECELHPSSSD